MEAPLITEESSNRGLEEEGGFGGGVYRRWKGHHKRSDAITHGTVYQRAAALVDLVSVVSSLFLLFSST